MKKLNNSLLLLLSILICLAVSGCSQPDNFKQDMMPLSAQNYEEPVLSGESEHIENNMMGTYIPTPYVDWESLDRIDYKNIDPLLPWLGGTESTIPRLIAQDHKKRDGWVLIYNTFGHDGANYYPFLMLYNIYRGVIRIFYYHSQGHNIQRLFSGLQFNGYSSQLNFNRDFALPMNNRSRTRHMKKFSSSAGSSTGVSPNQWYYFDYEVSYDERIKNYKDTDINMIFRAWGEDISKLTMQGTQAGSLEGTVEIPSSSSSLLSLGGINIKKSAVTSAGDIITQTFSGDGAESSLKVLAKEQIKKELGVAIGDAAGQLASGALNMMSSPLGNFVNSIIGASTSNNVGAINLKLSTKIDLSGEITLKKPIFTNQPLVPGVIHEGTGGFLPDYDKPLGVWNIDKQPVVRWISAWDFHRSSPFPLGGSAGEFAMYQQFYYLDKNSFTVKVNPEVLKKARVQSIKKEIFYYKEYSGPTRLDRGTPFQGILIAGKIVNSSPKDRWYTLPQNVLAFKVYGVSPSMVDYYRRYPSSAPQGSPDTRIVVKITLTLVPTDANSNTKPIIHVKTFLPKFEKKSGTTSCIPYDMLYKNL